MITQLNFESVHELLSFCNTDKKAYSSNRKGVKEFNILNNWEETLDVISTGWSQGTKNVSIVIEEILTEIGTSTYREELVPSTTGIFFDVGLVCSGQPECWFSEQNTNEVISTGQKIVTIGLNASVSAGLSTTAVIERGAAVLALAQLLEQMGKSVAIIQYCSTSQNIHTFQGSVVLKVPGEALDIDSLAFWLVCPDAFRRCWLRVLECVPTAKQLGALGESYGFPVSDYGKNKSDIFIEGIKSSKEWSRVDSLNWIKEKLYLQDVILQYTIK